MTPGERAERDRRWAGYEARQRAHECASLAVHWDGSYEFGHDGQSYWARRADSGEVIKRSWPAGLPRGGQDGLLPPACAPPPATSVRPGEMARNAGRALMPAIRRFWCWKPPLKVSITIAVMAFAVAFGVLALIMMHPVSVLHITP